MNNSENQVTMIIRWLVVFGHSLMIISYSQIVIFVIIDVTMIQDVVQAGRELIQSFSPSFHVLFHQHFLVCFVSYSTGYYLIFIFRH